MVSLFQIKVIDTVELFIRRVCNMGSYLNPGSASFHNSLRSKIYVDKSELICCAGIYDRNFAHKKIWLSFRFEYVHRVFYDKSA